MVEMVFQGKFLHMHKHLRHVHVTESNVPYTHRKEGKIVGWMGWIERDRHILVISCNHFGALKRSHTVNATIHP